MSTTHVVRDGSVVISAGPVDGNKKRVMRLETLCDNNTSGPAYLLPHQLRELGAELMALANQLESGR